jgi:ABC-2 type transport system permease protein
VSPRRTAATALRVLRQLRHDPRTVLLLLAVPLVLLALVKWVFSDSPAVFQRIGVPLLGIFPLTSMFLVTSITMLRERTGGTMERLLAGPMAKIDLLAGYALAFALVAVAQGAAAALVAFEFLGLRAEGPAVAVVAIAILNAVLGCSLGLFISAFATTEFQAVQFMPAFLLPQLLLCGLLQPRAEMARPLELFSYALPMTYAFDALRRIAVEGEASARLGVDLGILVGATVLALVLGAATLRRRTP